MNNNHGQHVVGFQIKDDNLGAKIDNSNFSLKLFLGPDAINMRWIKKGI